MLLPVRRLANLEARLFTGSLLSVIRRESSPNASYIIVRLSFVKVR